MTPTVDESDSLAIKGRGPQSHPTGLCATVLKFWQHNLHVRILSSARRQWWKLVLERGAFGPIAT
jgi:hypothetical protein